MEVPTGDVTECAMAGDGGTVLCSVFSGGTGITDYVLALEGGTREMATSWAFGTPWRSVDLADNGSTFAAAHGETVVVAHRGISDVFDTTIDDAFYRFDTEDDGDTLTFRAEVSTPATRVYVLPLYDRYVHPVDAIPAEEDPTYLMRFGIDLAPLEDDPTTYEATVPLSADRSLLTGSFTFRIVATTGPDTSTQPNQASYRDIALTE